MSILSISFPTEEYLGIAYGDLRRLKVKYEIGIEPKSEAREILWESNGIPISGDYAAFKDAYIIEENHLQHWLDNARWIKGIKTSDCWLGFTRIDTNIKFVIYQSA